MKHPIGMYIISTTEMWERFSFYIFVSILVLFMMQVLHFSSEYSTFLYGFILGGTYLFQLVAGYITDTYISNRKSIVIGGIFMFISQIIFTYDASLFNLTTNVAEHSTLIFNYPEMVFLVGILFMIIGSGFFKVSVTSFVSLFYEEDDERLDSAFTIFYMFINIGGFLAPLITNFIVGVNNPSLYQYGFLIGGIIVLLGTVMFIALQRYLVLPNGEPVGTIPVSKNKRFMERKADKEQMPGKLTRVEIDRLFVIGLVLIVVILFYLSLEQISTSFILFEMIYVNNVIPFTNFEISPELFLSIPPLLVIFFSPLLLKFTDIIAEKYRDPSSISKFGHGLIITSLGFVALWLSLYTLDSNMQINMGWMILFSIFLVIGELLVMPIALSLISKLSPPKYTSLMMGVMFAATAVSEILAGVFASAFPETLYEPTMLLNIIPLSGIASFMWVFIIILAGPGIIWLLLRNKIKKYAHGVF